MSLRKDLDAKSINPPKDMWLTDEEINHLKKLKLVKGKRYHRPEINALLQKQGIKWECPYSIINGGDGLYAVYRNNKENKSFLLGEGGTSKVKDLQKLDKDAKDKNDWVLKTIYQSKVKDVKFFDDIANAEVKNLQQTGLGKSLIIKTVSKKDGQQKRGLMMKKAKGVQLLELMEKKELNPDSDMLKKIVINILMKLDEMHKKGFIIRDLKLPNIMVDSNGNVYFVDTALWIKHKKGVASDDYVCGTRQYVPKEVFSGGKYTIASDTYAAGFIIKALLTGKILCYNNESKNCYYSNDGITRIVKTKDGMDKEYKIEKEIEDMINNMMDNDNPKNRPTLQAVCDVIMKYMPKDPDKAQSSEMKHEPSEKNKSSGKNSSDAALMAQLGVLKRVDKPLPKNHVRSKCSIL